MAPTSAGQAARDSRGFNTDCRDHCGVSGGRRFALKGCHPGLYRAADNCAAAQIHDDGRIEPALVGRNLGDIGHPRLIGCGRLKLSVEQVVRHRLGVHRIRRRLVTPLVLGTS